VADLVFQFQVVAEETTLDVPAARQRLMHPGQVDRSYRLPNVCFVADEFHDAFANNNDVRL
jgi:hypothetical protein